jgi:hypothetical protein
MPAGRENRQPVLAGKKAERDANARPTAVDRRAGPEGPQTPANCTPSKTRVGV